MYGRIFLSYTSIPLRHQLIKSIFCLFCSTTAWAPDFVAEGQIQAQEAANSISGTVVDPAGALIPEATITAKSSDGKTYTIKSDTAGNYTLKTLLPGLYTLDVSAPGFASFHRDHISIRSGQNLHLNISLRIEALNQQVMVSDENSEAEATPGTGGAAIVLRGSDLDTLSDDRDEMQTELEALAGGVGDSGNQFFIDGFSGGKLPPKDTIREIRINQNPYSAQYDSLGFGRIEILTRPGADKFHGELASSGNDSSFNSMNKFITSQPPYHSYDIYGHVNGPISKQSSFLVELTHSDSQNNSIVKAVGLDSDLNQVSISQAVSNPNSSITFNPRIDWQLGKNNTFTLRYQLDRSTTDSSGIQGLSLPSQGYNSRTTVQNWRIGDTQIFGPHIVDEMRFQYIRTRTYQAAIDDSPTIIVQGSFNGGGNNLGVVRDNTDRYEFQDYLSVAAGKHFVRFGGRFRAARDANRSTASYNGEFIFPSLSSYQTTLIGLRDGWSALQIRNNGGGATQFNISTGNPNIAVSMIDTGLYGEEDWKIAKTFTLSYGLRFETQTGIADHANFAPRLGFTWGVGKNKSGGPTFVIRGGHGWYYQRFETSPILQAQRQNGQMQQQYVVSNPDFYPNIPSVDSLANVTQSAIYRISPTIQSPLTMVAGIGIEHSFGKRGTLSANYTYNRMVHSFLTRNINAPLPGTYDPTDASSGTRPYGGTRNIYEYESEGSGKRNRFVINGNASLARKFTMYGSYTLMFNRANTSGLSSFPSNQYNLHQDWGRASYDTRHWASFGGSTQLPFGFRCNEFFIAQSGGPFNIVIGKDLNGDSQYNDRPTFATDLSRSSVMQTKWGTFDTSPLAGQTTIPMNFGRGPAIFILNGNLSKIFSFGPESKGSSAPTPKGEKPKVDYRYQLRFGVYSNNILNHVNLSRPVGTLSSSLFGKSNSLYTWSSAGSANRTVEAYVHFSF